jgi:hypothetical protein
MTDWTKHPTLDPAVRAVPASSSIDAEGAPVCADCRKRLRFNFGWGYEGEGHFCSMKCAARWASDKVLGTSDGYIDDDIHAARNPWR